MISTLIRKISAASLREIALYTATSVLLTISIHLLTKYLDNKLLIIVLRGVEFLMVCLAGVLLIYFALELMDQAFSRKTVRPKIIIKSRFLFPVQRRFINMHGSLFQKFDGYASGVKIFTGIFVGALIFAFTLSLIPWGSLKFSANDNVVEAAPKVLTKAEPKKVGKQKYSQRAKFSHSVYDQLIIETCARYGMDPDLIKAMIYTESYFDPETTSTAGAKGLMQLMPATARQWNVHNRNDPVLNLDGGVRYFKYLLSKYKGNVRLSLAAYNAGEGNVEKYKGIPPFKETLKYIPKVLARQRYYQKYESLASRMVKPKPVQVAERTFFEKIKDFFAATASAG